MGKKRVATKTTEELIAERERVESAVTKETKAAPKRVLERAKIYISSSFNNTIMTLTDMRGNTLAWVSAGSVGFGGTKKATPFAASKVAEAISQIVKRMGIPSVEVYVKGLGSGRDSAIRSLAARGIEIDLLKDITPIPHNGCRPPKVRRV